MNDESGWFKVAVGLICLFGFILLFWLLNSRLQASSQTDAAIKLPLLVITGVMALFTTLALVAVTFSVAGLSDKSQALGLPEGSIRAAIALSLIVIFSITSIFLFNSIMAATPDTSNTAAAVDFGKQVFAVVGTLMTAVASFYFASRASTTAAAAAVVSAPTLTSLSPTEAAKGAVRVVVPIKIFGTDLQLAKTVKFDMSGSAVLATDVTSSSELVKCELAIEPGLAPGKYGVTVTTSDDSTAVLPNAFEVRQADGGAAGGGAAGGGAASGGAAGGGAAGGGAAGGGAAGGGAAGGGAAGGGAASGGAAGGGAAGGGAASGDAAGGGAASGGAASGGATGGDAAGGGAAGGAPGGGQG